jgi:uncharacterized protein with PQ loop repeat
MISTNELFLFIGTVGTICFSLSGLPQAIKSFKDGHSNGLANGTLWLWLIGEAAMLIYSVHFYTKDFVLITNYVVNFVLVSIIFKYKYFKRQKHVQ